MKGWDLSSVGELAVEARLMELGHSHPSGWEVSIQDVLQEALGGSGRRVGLGIKDGRRER